MPQRSAGLLLFRRRNSRIEVFLVHPGGPFWAKKDLGVWSIPKGLIDDGEDPIDAAQREFEEETGFPRPHGEFTALGELKQPSGKIVAAWAIEGDCDPAQLRSTMCTIKWPPRSGREIEIPEVDRGEWFTLDAAQERILRGQRGFVERISLALNGR